MSAILCEICVFHGWIWRFSGPGSEELWRCQNSCIFGADFGVSLAQSAEELWRCQNSCLSGADFGISLAQSAEKLWRSQNSSLFWGLFLAFLWPKVPKNPGVPKICVFLHPEMLKFCGVGELSCWGHKLKIKC